MLLQTVYGRVQGLQTAASISPGNSVLDFDTHHMNFPFLVSKKWYPNQGVIGGRKTPWLPTLCWELTSGNPCQIGPFHWRWVEPVLAGIASKDGQNPGLVQCQNLEVPRNGFNPRDGLEHHRNFQNIFLVSESIDRPCRMAKRSMNSSGLRHVAKRSWAWCASMSSGWLALHSVGISWKTLGINSWPFKK